MKEWMIRQMCSSMKEWWSWCRRKVKVCGCQKLKIEWRAIILSHITAGQQTTFLCHRPTNFPFPKTGIQNITLHCNKEWPLNACWQHARCPPSASNITMDWGTSPRRGKVIVKPITWTTLVLWLYYESASGDGSFQLNMEAGHSSNFRKQILYAEALSVAATWTYAASDSCKYKTNALHEFWANKAIPNYEYR